MLFRQATTYQGAWPTARPRSELAAASTASCMPMLPIGAAARDAWRLKLMVPRKRRYRRHRPLMTHQAARSIKQYKLGKLRILRWVATTRSVGDALARP